VIKPRLFLCSGVKLPSGDHPAEDREVVELDSIGHNPTVNIQLEDVAEVFLRNVPPRLVDLLEIASYVYAADCATRRGQDWAEASVEAWGRDFHFIVPVRDMTFWSREDVKEALQSLLHFLSDDAFAFTFRPLESDRPLQEYIQLGQQSDWPFYGAESVLMFSGGLDSLAGAAEAAVQGSNLVLVSHRPVSTVSRRQRALFRELRRTYTSRMIHVPVWINKAKRYGREHTQRTRSFLYSAVGTVVAESVRARGVRFFENGVVSLNLPVADEVLRARASRTTHPIALEMFTRFYSTLAERQLLVDNPYLFSTKADIVSSAASHGGASLIGLTCSCAHAFFQSKTQWHCGACSQCIDRRVAILAAGLEQHDPATDYVADVFTGPRKEGQDRSMAIDYVRHGLELHRMSEAEMAAKFNLELTRATRFMPNRSAAAQQFIEMHKRHGEAVQRVLTRELQRNASLLVEKGLDQTSMLAVIAGQRHLEPLWNRYAEKIGEILDAGVPTACQTHRPRDEKHLQEVCNGILKGHDLNLVREFPFLRWSSSLTKPDWSIGLNDLWVEAKYIRGKDNIRRATEDMAADITKYGDNVSYVLFVVYDPSHLITDEDGFSAPIRSRPNMSLQLIR
jgi:7-cyano-7-deazaguanine synthase in queuosine biosynthesis